MRLHITNEFSRSKLHIRIICPCSIPKSKAAAAGELLHRINSKIPSGHLEYDFERGAVSYRHSVSYAGITQYEDDYADQFIGSAIVLTDIFFPLIKEFAGSGKSAGSPASLPERFIRRVDEYKIN